MLYFILAFQIFRMKLIFTFFLLSLFKLSHAQNLVPFATYDETLWYQFYNPETKQKKVEKYQSILPYNNYYLVRDFNQKTGLYNRSGKEIVPIKYDKISTFENNIILAYNNYKKQDLYNNLGVLISENQYDLIEYNDSLTFIVTIDHKKGLIDKNGKVLVTCKHDLLRKITGGLLSENFVAYDERNQNGSYGFIDNNYQEIFPANFHWGSLGDGVYIFSNEKKSVIYNHGKIIEIPNKISNQYSSTSNTYSVLFNEQDNSIWLFNKKTNELIFESSYIDASEIDKGIDIRVTTFKSKQEYDAATLEQKKITKYFYSKSGRKITKKGCLLREMYDGYFSFFADTGKTQKMGLMDTNGNEIIPAKYFKIIAWCNKYVVAQESPSKENNFAYCIVDIATGKIKFRWIESQQIYTTAVKESVLMFSKRWFVFNQKSEKMDSINATVYDGQSLLRSVITIKSTPDKYPHQHYGLIDLTGKEIFPAKFISIKNIGGFEYKNCGVLEMTGYDSLSKSQQTFLYNEKSGISSDKFNRIETLDGKDMKRNPNPYHPRFTVAGESRYYGTIKVVDGIDYLGLLDSTGKEIIKPIEATNIFIDSKYIFVRKSYEMAMLNFKGDTIIPFKYNSLSFFNDSILKAVSMNGEMGLIDIKENIIMPFEYKNITSYFNGELIGIELDGGGFPVFSKMNGKLYYNEKKTE